MFLNFEHKIRFHKKRSGCHSFYDTVRCPLSKREPIHSATKLLFLILEIKEIFEMYILLPFFTIFVKIFEIKKQHILEGTSWLVLACDKHCVSNFMSIPLKKERF